MSRASVERPHACATSGEAVSTAIVWPAGGVTRGGGLAFRIQDEPCAAPGWVGSPRSRAHCAGMRGTADTMREERGEGEDTATARPGAGGRALGEPDDRTGIVPSAGTGQGAPADCRP
jgi:hypothetical protein